TYGCYAIAKFIEKSTGEVATPLSTGPMTNGAQTSIRHAAAAAGLGEFGWMGIILTPEYGPRNRFGVILTTLELEPDSMYSGQRLCNPEKCGICAAVCPTGALEEYGEGVGCRVKVGDREYNYTQVNWARCFLAEHAMTTRYGGRENFIDPNNTDPSMAEVGTAMAKMPPSEMGLQHHESHHCGKCLSYCPAGKWGEKFKKRGLTGGAAAIKFPE
ncbi:MAG: hypothetical protein LBC78_03690, partial [Oscillospiraceae bacterium]|nr:hypothetical protein [Oscillospiraceae bacterium]